MRGFVKTVIVFVYLIFALFIQQCGVLACENITQNTSQYFISSTKPETIITNGRKEEYYIILQSRNKSEISNPSNKNNNLNFNGVDKTNITNNIPVRLDDNNLIYPICISYNISPHLKNAIYTRAP